ncbi:MAG: lysophospholipase [Planctomycetota bacterium]|nr:lysophospholipase [Planctomycetota bacterium]MDA1212997.1 lysophospholipase [Planctomycetota bacterium]
MKPPVEEIVTTPDGIPLSTLRYAAENPSAGTILFTHGACEHSGRYLVIFAALQKAGWNVLAWDLRGHGRSGGLRAHIDSFEDYLRDVDLLRQHFQLEDHSTAMMGHSMGGLVTIRYAQTRQLKCRGLVLLSPLLRIAVPIPSWLLTIGKCLKWLAPRQRFRNRVRQKDTTHDPQQLAIRRQDPFIQRKVTVNWFYSVETAIEQAWRDVGGLQSPALILQADDDRIVCPEATKRWCERATGSETTYNGLADHYHELLHEADRLETLEMCVGWLNERVD